jgi:hypothetical protein
MRSLVDIVENVTSSIRYVVGALFLLFVCLGLFVTVAASFVVPVAVDKMGERAERLGERAIQAELEQRRAEQLARDGWGYRAPEEVPAEEPPADNGDKKKWFE